MDYNKYKEEIRIQIEYIQKNRGINASLVLKCCSELEEYALKNDDASLLGFAYFNMGETYYLLNDGDHMFRYITRAVTYLNESKQWEQVAEAYNIMAITSLNRGNVSIAMDYYLTGLNYCKKYLLTRQEHIINLNVGNLYLMNGQENEAQRYFEKVKYYVEQNKESEEYANFMTYIHMNLGRCYLQKGMVEKTQECVEYIDNNFWDALPKIERLCVLCFKARFYYSTGKNTLCEECIEQIRTHMDSDLAIMDIFDDLYDFVELLLDMDKKEMFWDAIKIVEKMVKKSEIIYLQRKIVSLKIKWYRKHMDNEQYLKETGVYYELTEAMEKDNQYMMANMLNVRNSLERANEMRREAEAANERLQKKSETDPLTNLANRFRLNDYSESAVEWAKKKRQTLAMELLDIDYFKEYNDNYGHQAGDDCIVAISNELEKMQKEGIFCARYGGDEFVIIYENMTEEEVYDKASMLRQNIMSLNIEHIHSKAAKVVTISQGICFDIPEEGNKSWDFLHAADTMLYQVKRHHRNNIVMGNLRQNVIKTGTSVE